MNAIEFQGANVKGPNPNEMICFFSVIYIYKKRRQIPTFVFPFTLMTKNQKVVSQVIKSSILT